MYTCTIKCSQAGCSSIVACSSDLPLADNEEVPKIFDPAAVQDILLVQDEDSPGDSLTVEDEEPIEKVAERIVHGMPQAWIKMFCGQQPCSLVDLPYATVRVRDIVNNRPMVEGCTIEFPNRTPSLKYCTDLADAIDRFLGGAVYKEGDPKTRKAMNKVEGMKLKMVPQGDSS